MVVAIMKNKQVGTNNWKNFLFMYPNKNVPLQTSTFLQLTSPLMKKKSGIWKEYIILCKRAVS